MAAARAQALIDAHRLQHLLDTDRDDPIADGRTHPLESSRRLRKWKRVLAQSLASLNGCIAYTEQAGKMKHLVLVGTQSDRAAVVALWEWLVRRIEWLSASHGEGRDRGWHEAFRVGAVVTITERLRAGQQDTTAQLETAALVRVREGLARRQQRVAEFAQRSLNLKTGRGVRVDPDAYRLGRAAGGAVVLPK